jgi:hypothetical protein
MNQSKKPAGKSKAELLAAKLASKNTALRAAEDDILHLRDEIREKSASLKQLRASQKSVRVANARIASHLKEYDVDQRKRPSDRGNDIRQYTKMDLDVWAYPQVRDWFNSQATDEDFSYNLRPSETGYMIQVENDYKHTHS